MRNIHWIKVVQVLNRCSVVISFCHLLSIKKLTFNEGTTSRAHKYSLIKGANTGSVKEEASYLIRLGLILPFPNALVGSTVVNASNTSED